MSKPRLDGFAIPLLLASVIACGSEPVSSNAKAYLDGRGAAYDMHIQAAFANFSSQDLGEARRELNLALTSVRDEEPNYEPFILLAQVECAAGNFAQAQALIEDATCALNVESGKLACPEPPDERSFVSLGGTVQCSRAMCGEMFAGYYPSKLAKQVARVQALRSELDVVKAGCSEQRRF